MLLRLIPEFGGDRTTHGIIAMNDTGSDLLTLFDDDFPFLGNTVGYSGWLGPVRILDANGNVPVFPQIRVQVQMVRDDNTPWGDWMEETAIVRVRNPNVSRLSGRGIRAHLYFATAPGNHTVAVATTKGGLMSLL